jgi:hypothetical protein
MVRKMKSHEKSYNDRLFRGGIRRWLHEARFLWIKKMVIKYQPDNSCIVELGCFDGRVLKYIPSPKLYFGFDADWEGGLTNAKSTYAGNSLYHFIKCIVPEELDTDHNEPTFAISLETLEHIPPEILQGYINRLSNIIRSGGYFFVSVPNEKGIIFFFKHLVKLIFLEGAKKYTFSEFIWATIGRLDKVERSDHKGFDWLVLQRELEKEFYLIESAGIQMPWLPRSMNASIGMVFRKA